MLREDFLQQSAFGDDAFSPFPKSYGILKAILAFYDEGSAALKRGMLMDDILNLPAIEQIARLKDVPKEQFEAHITEFFRQLPQALAVQPASAGS